MGRRVLIPFTCGICVWKQMFSQGCVCGTLSCVWKRMHTLPSVIGARVKAGLREGPSCAWLSWIPSFFPSRLEYSSWQHVHRNLPSVTEGRTGRWITLRHKASAPFELRSIYAGHPVHVDRIHIWPPSLWVRAAGASFYTFFSLRHTARCSRPLYSRLPGFVGESGATKNYFFINPLRAMAVNMMWQGGWHCVAVKCKYANTIPQGRLPRNLGYVIVLKRDTGSQIN